MRCGLLVTGNCRKLNGIPYPAWAACHDIPLSLSALPDAGRVLILNGDSPVKSHLRTILSIFGKSVLTGGTLRISNCLRRLRRVFEI